MWKRRLQKKDSGGKGQTKVPQVDPPMAEFRRRSNTLPSTPHAFAKPGKRVPINDGVGGLAVDHMTLRARLQSCDTLSGDDLHRSCENIHTLSSPRHLFRRGALAGSDLVHLRPRAAAQQSSLEDSNVLTVVFEDQDSQFKDTAPTRDVQSLRDLLEFVCMIKNALNISDLSRYHVTATRGNSPLPVDLDSPSTQYAASIVEIRPIPPPPGEGGEAAKTAFETVSDCLAYFSEHGLVELPLPPGWDEGETFRLPRVTPLDAIAEDWDSLPIHHSLKQALSSKEYEQQRSMWELIQTEYSHIRHLETVINLFMRSLELIKRAKILTENGYHNIFGYFDDIHHAHEQFWTHTLEPCLQKVYETGEPLCLTELIDAFPHFATQFEGYTQHLELQSLNLSTLNEAMANKDFVTYLEWCEAQPQCQRKKLRELLDLPWDRLSKYKLLLLAVAKRTADPYDKSRLEHHATEVDEFVQSVNTDLMTQEESERVRDIMTRLTSYSAVEVPSELREILLPHTHLDLLAPMPGVEVDRSRVFMLEGNLKYRDTNGKTVVRVFLFTDMLLVTKPNRRDSQRCSIWKPPYKISSLSLHPLEPESFAVVVIGEYRVTSSWFVLKANTASVAQQWMEQIDTAQKFYKEAVEHKQLNCKLLRTLRSERTLNGLDPLNDSLNGASWSQSLWSLNGSPSTLPRRNHTHHSTLSATLSTESLASPRLPLKRTHSAEVQNQTNVSLLRKQTSGGALGDGVAGGGARGNSPTYSKSLMDRTQSLGMLVENPGELTASAPSIASSGSNAPGNRNVPFARLRSGSVDTVGSHFNVRFDPAAVNQLEAMRGSPISDDSGTESGDMPFKDVCFRGNANGVLRSRKSNSLPAIHQQSFTFPCSNSMLSGSNTAAAQSGSNSTTPPSCTHSPRSILRKRSGKDSEVSMATVVNVVPPTPPTHRRTNSLEPVNTLSPPSPSSQRHPLTPSPTTPPPRRWSSNLPPIQDVHCTPSPLTPSPLTPLTPPPQRCSSPLAPVEDTSDNLSPPSPLTSSPASPPPITPLTQIVSLVLSSSEDSITTATELDTSIELESDTEVSDVKGRGSEVKVQAEGCQGSNEEQDQESESQQDEESKDQMEECSEKQGGEEGKGRQRRLLRDQLRGSKWELYEANRKISVQYSAPPPLSLLRQARPSLQQQSEPITQGRPSSLQQQSEPITQGRPSSLQQQSEPITQGHSSLQQQSEPITQGRPSSLQQQSEPITQGCLSSLQQQSEPITQGHSSLQQQSEPITQGRPSSLQQQSEPITQGRPSSLQQQQEAVVVEPVLTTAQLAAVLSDDGSCDTLEEGGNEGDGIGTHSNAIQSRSKAAWSSEKSYSTESETPVLDSPIPDNSRSHSVPVNVTPVHKRSSGKKVHELLQMFETTPPTSPNRHANGPTSPKKVSRFSRQSFSPEFSAPSNASRKAGMNHHKVTRSLSDSGEVNARPMRKPRISTPWVSTKTPSIDTLKNGPIPSKTPLPSIDDTPPTAPPQCLNDSSSSSTIGESVSNEVCDATLKEKSSEVLSEESVKELENGDCVRTVLKFSVEAKEDKAATGATERHTNSPPTVDLLSTEGESSETVHHNTCDEDSEQRAVSSGNQAAPDSTKQTDAAPLDSKQTRGTRPAGGKHATSSYKRSTCTSGPRAVSHSPAAKTARPSLANQQGSGSTHTATRRVSQTTSEGRQTTGSRRLSQSPSSSRRLSQVTSESSQTTGTKRLSQSLSAGLSSRSGRSSRDRTSTPAGSIATVTMNHRPPSSNHFTTRTLNKEPQASDIDLSHTLDSSRKKSCPIARATQPQVKFRKHSDNDVALNSSIRSLSIFPNGSPSFVKVNSNNTSSSRTKVELAMKTKA